MPKMAAHSWTYPIAQTVTAYYWHNVGDDSIHMAVADTGWAKAGWGKLYGQWICGATLFVYDFDRFIAADLLKMLEKHRVTSFCAPPTVYRFLIKEDLSGYDLSALKWANCAGEPLNPEVYDQFLRLTGVKIHEGFGQSETTPLLMTSKWMEPKTGSTGRPSPAYDIALVDENGQDVDDGVEGEIVIRLDKGHPAGLFLAITAIRSRPTRYSITVCTTPETWPGAMWTATITSLAAATTSSSPAATASVPSRWRARCSPTRRCWNAR